MFDKFLPTVLLLLGVTAVLAARKSSQPKMDKYHHVYPTTSSRTDNTDNRTSLDMSVGYVYTNLRGNKVSLNKDLSRTSLSYMALILIGISGDVEMNPGPYMPEYPLVRCANNH